MGDQVLGKATLIRRDMATSRLLNNSDRELGFGVHCRDLIDLAMLDLNKAERTNTTDKAKAAYGDSMINDFIQVAKRLSDIPGLLKPCINAMDI